MLQAPSGWQISPQRFAFRMPADIGRQQPVEIRYPPNEPAGRKEITAHVVFETEPPYVLDIPLRFELGLDKIDVTGFTFREGSDLVVRQVVTNRSGGPVSFRSFAIAPGRSRQIRVVHNLKPGVTVNQEFRFKSGDELSQRTIRLGLREIDGPRRHIIELEAP
jgi:hypothetical protein